MSPMPTPKRWRAPAPPALAFVLDDITGPSFAHMAHGVEREAARLGHLCLVCSTDGDTGHELEYDDENGAFALCAHVLAQGHRRVLFLGGSPENTAAQGRERGYLAAHRARGIEPEPALRLSGDFTRDSGHRLLRRALDQGLAFTAVMAATDMVAVGRSPLCTRRG